MIIIRRVDEGGTIRLTLAGDLDLATVGTLQDEVERALIGDLPDELVVDLAGVTFCDSTGVGALVTARAAAIAVGVRFRVVNVGEITSLPMRILDVYATLTAPGPGYR